MTRISLRETYDNRSVIAQIAKVTDTAEDAAETVEQKAAEINDALTEVNAAVQAAEGAVQAAEGAVTTANAASAAAQQSAQTVAGYENRLEQTESNLNAVTLRVQTAEGQIVTIQGRVTALETADGQNVKLNVPQTITAPKTFSGLIKATGQGAYNPNDTDNVATIGTLNAYTPMIRNTNAQIMTGPLTLIGVRDNALKLKGINYDFTAVGLYFNLPALEFYDKNDLMVARLGCRNTAGGTTEVYLDIRKPDGTNNTVVLGANN